jgi:hypothetical protein
MGGMGSGRQGGRPTAEATQSFVFNIAWLTRDRLRPGMYGKTTITFNDEPVEVTIDTRAEPYIELEHDARCAWSPNRVRYRISLAWTPCRFCGRRWWFVCLRTGRYVAKLYLPYGGERFWSRRAYRLGYASQREGRRDRATRRLRHIERALGNFGDELPVEPPDKPKWMRWGTYERKLDEWERASDAVEQASALSVAPFPQRVG